MRKIHITESQWKKILMAESEYPLDVKNDDGKPDNFTEYEVAVSNNDKDVPDTDVMTGEAFKKSKDGWFGMGRYPAMHRLPESRELDNAKNSGYGVNNDNYINKAAQNGGGKMISNINTEVKSNTDGSRNATNMMRISRMEDYKRNNPDLFMKNGGDQTLNILKNQTKKQSTAHAAKHATDVRTVSTQPGDNVNYGKNENGAYYFK